jgi:hypothetical protein
MQPAPDYARVSRAIEASRMVLATPEAFKPDQIAAAVRVLKKHAPEAVKLEIV